MAFARGARVGVRMVRMSAAVKTASNAAGELGVAVPDQEPETEAGIVGVQEEVAGLFGQPGAGGVGGDAEDVYSADGVLDDEERVEPVQGDGVDMEQVAGEDRLCLRPQELRPGRACLPGCGSLPAVCRMFQMVEAPIR
jgi:hypothetical protein